MASCTVCGKRSYSAYCVSHKPRKPLKRTALPLPTKRIKQRGKRSYELEAWVKNVARPYLIATYGERCVWPGCYETKALDVDHILNKGSRPDLKMSLTNVQFLCRPHHRMKTDRLLKSQ